MKHLNSIENFYDALKDIAIENLNLDKKRKQLRKYVYDYNNNIQKISIEKSLKKQNKEIEKLLNETINVLKVSSNKWVDNFDKILEKEKFRNDLKNYFIIIIFGKVKAGKSSLGNFIAQKRPTNEKVTFFKYDETGKEKSIKKLEEIEDNSFDTDNLECTVAIQGFKLSAMAWIDTPGLGSMVEENGKKAREYIEAADYIIYPTSSDSPLQADERLQVKELFEKNKKVTICITKSDNRKRKKDKSGKYIKKNGKIAKFLVNKSPKNRLKQEQYVKEEISKINHNQSLLGDIISISVHTAKLGLDEKDHQLFENSNIPKFYEIITKVVKEKATKLKSETPYNELKSFIDNDVLGISGDKKFTIKIIRNLINDLDKNINERVKNLNILIENIKSDIYTEVNDVVEKNYTNINKYNSKKMFKEINTKIADNISKMIELNIQKIFENFSCSLKNLTTSMSEDEFKIDNIYEEYTYSTKKRNKGIGAALFGGLATVGTAIATGGTSLVIEAGATIAAGATGAYLGSKAGEMTGSQHTEKINVGDNKEEVIRNFKEKQINIYIDGSKKIYNQIKSSFFNPLQNEIKNMKEELNTMENNINFFKEKELS